jgi:hypothetical protein
MTRARDKDEALAKVKRFAGDRHWPLHVFSSLVTINPPVMSRARWSAWNIAWQPYHGTLPQPSGVFRAPSFLNVAWTYSSFNGIALAYLLLLVALVALFSPRYQKALKVIALIGLIASGQALKFGSGDFGSMFFGPAGTAVEWNGGIRYGAAMYAVPAVMAALLLVAMTAGTLDPDQSLKRKQIDA